MTIVIIIPLNLVDIVNNSIGTGYILFFSNINLSLKEGGVPAFSWFFPSS